MAFSDDEEEEVLQAVTNYYFTDQAEEPVSFSALPLRFMDIESSDSPVKKQVFLHGTADRGLQKIYKQVIAWKLEFGEQPEITVLLKDGNWIKLLKPRKSFEDTIRTISVTLNCLHFLKKNPEASEMLLHEHLQKSSSSYDAEPSGYELLEHESLIRLMVEKDDTLGKSQLLLSFLAGPSQWKGFNQNVALSQDENKGNFIVDDDDIEATGEEGDEASDLFDSVCAICDNGGEILPCEGRCLRSFHPTRASGAESQCKSLGLTKSQVEEMKRFYCPNCAHDMHQCFACGKLGSSNKAAQPEVFPCVSATCGHFYHPECVAKLLHPGDEAETEERKRKIVTGESFICPVHKCTVCKQGENKEVRDLQFALCRRCPKAYHRKCLPSKIAFEDSESDNDDDVPIRAWDDLLPNRILIYCLKHKIDEDLGTPIRDHLIFPGVPGKKQATETSKKKVLGKKRRQPSEEEPFKEKIVRDASSTLEEVSSTGKREKSIHGTFHMKHKVVERSRDRPLKEGSTKHIVSKKAQAAATGNIDSVALTNDLKPKPVTKVGLVTKSDKTLQESSIKTKKSSCSLPVLDEETKQSIVAIVRKSSLLTVNDMLNMNKKMMPSTHCYISTNMDKNITHGKVEGSVEAVRTALRKLEEGGSIEDAKAVCEPEIINHILRWRNKLKVYLAPFLHGMRYTSYGRHFTDPNKLKEIVEKLHWYVLNGDMVVDFCCGANDFSILMEKKLRGTGKKCCFRNYDIIQPKNDFCFEKRDWMTVKPDELPTGSKLIMGLNPPFGVKAALANKFIDKALSFKPKLLILIAPPETERLDKKKDAYDLIWEDDEKLSGKSFYLPGSVDVHDKQMEQWNLTPPLLYLWSRPDWTSKHIDIAVQRGHRSLGHEVGGTGQQANVIGHSQSHSNLSKIYEHSNQDDPIERRQRQVQNEDAVDQKDEKRSNLPSKENGENGEKGSSAKLKETDQRESRHEQSPVVAQQRGQKRHHKSADEMEERMEKKSRGVSRTPESMEAHRSNVSGDVAVTDDGWMSAQGRKDGIDPTAYGVGQRSESDSVDEIARRYSLSRGEHIPGGGLSGGTERRGSLDVGHGSPYYGTGQSALRGLGSDFYARATYMDDLEVRHRREDDLHMHHQIYGRSGSMDFPQRGSYNLGQFPDYGNGGPFPTSYGRTDVDEISRLGSSTMHRYAPRLNDYAQVPSRQFGNEAVPSLTRDSMFNSPLPRTGYQSDSWNYAPGR